MTTLGVIQARMGSTRLPGKVVADLGGRPLLRFMVDRVLRARSLDRIVVATSTHPRDDIVAFVAAEAGVQVIRGSEDDVVGRFALALDVYPADVVVRLTADCPLADPSIIDAAVSLQRQSGAAYASNTLIRTYPDGLDVEVIDATVLEVAASEAATGPEREHVTPFVYRNPQRFPLVALVHESRLGHERWTIDTAADLDRVRRAVSLLGTDDFGWLDAIPAFEPLLPRPQLSPNIDGPAGIDPARRSWTMRTEAGAVTATVSVGPAGKGVLEVQPSTIMNTIGERLLDELQQLLRADLQVTELSLDGNPFGDVTLRAHGWRAERQRWHWRPSR